MATHKIRRPSSSLETVQVRKKRKPDVSVSQSSSSSSNICRTTENEYIELSKSFQTVLNEKYNEISQLKRQVKNLEDKLYYATKGRDLLRQCYLRSISELADERLRGERLAEYKTRSDKALTDLHSFVVNENVRSLDNYESDAASESSDSDDDGE